MGKRIIQQARGKGSLTYRVRKKAFNKKIGYPSKQGEAEIIAIVHSAAHSAPLAKIKIDDKTFYNPETGVLAGWKSADGQLHDYYFTFVNGIAISYDLIEQQQAHAIMDAIHEFLRIIAI